MAFMMPVMKNEFDIYNGSRSRKLSETSNSSNNNRSRKVSECKSECQSFSTSPANDSMISPTHRQPINRSVSKGFSRNSSRTSQSSFTMSPTRSYSQTSSPPKTINNPTNHSGSQGSINKFHSRLVDKLRKSFRKDAAKRS